MIGWLIVACEIGFWIFVLAGLFFRYILKKTKIGTILLICTPIVDLILLIATVIDLMNGAIATSVHGIAAIYIGVSIVYGHQMIQWADRQFAYRFAAGEKPINKKTYGKEHARNERLGWYQHLLSWLIGGTLLVIIIFIVSDISRTEALARILQLWSFILIIDFVISFSYTLFPKKEQR